MCNKFTPELNAIMSLGVCVCVCVCVCVRAHAFVWNGMLKNIMFRL